MAPPDLAPARKKPKKPGKTLSTISDRVYRPKRVTAIKRPQKNCSRNRKIEVLMFIHHHRVVLEPSGVGYRLPRVPVGLEITSEKKLNGTTIYYRPPTFSEASNFWKVPLRTIEYWWAHQATILEPQRKAYLPAWPELEDRLYEVFLATRQAGKLVTVDAPRRSCLLSSTLRVTPFSPSREGGLMAFLIVTISRAAASPRRRPNCLANMSKWPTRF